MGSSHRKQIVAQTIKAHLRQDALLLWGAMHLEGHEYRQIGDDECTVGNRPRHSLECLLGAEGVPASGRQQL
eukprot:4091670-Prymnesium_polylepis.1